MGIAAEDLPRISKLAELLLAKMLASGVSTVFDISLPSMLSAAVYFAVIFFLIMLNSLRQISLSKPIELMKSESFGEKLPKANYFFAIIGIILLAAAYFITSKRYYRIVSGKE